MKIVHLEKKIPNKTYVYGDRKWCTAESEVTKLRGRGSVSREGQVGQRLEGSGADKKL